MNNFNEKIKKLVVNNLCDNSEFDASRITVTVRDGVVELTGSVSNESERDLGAGIAKSIPQVGEVLNHIAIINEPLEDPQRHVA